MNLGYERFVGSIVIVSLRAALLNSHWIESPDDPVHAPHVQRNLENGGQTDFRG